MRILLMLLVSLFICVSCKGPITGHEYSKEEIIQALKFVGVSAQRIKMYKEGKITLEELQISKERLEKAINYIENLKKEEELKAKRGGD